MHLRSRLLLATTIISAVTSSLALAGGLQVKLGGHMDMMVGSRTQKPTYNNLYNVDPTVASAASIDKALASDGRIDINIDSEEENNMKYGGLLSLNADPSDSTQGEKGLVNKAMIYWQHSKIGRFEAGNYYGAGGMFEMTPTNFAKAGYGVHGYWSSWVNDAAYVDLSSTVLNAYLPTSKVLMPGLMPYKYLYSPNLPSNYSGKHYAAAPKVTYYTIPLPGLTFGVSFIPDMDSTGTITTQAGAESGPTDPERNTSRPTFRNIISGGLLYEVDLAAVKLRSSITGEVGKAKKYQGTDLVNDLKAYEVGFGATHGQYSVGASYGNWGKTGTYRQRYDNTKQGANYWTAVLAKQQEKLGYSLSYMQSKRAGGLEAIGSNLQSGFAKKINAATNNSLDTTPGKDATFSDNSYNTLKVVSLGIDYKIAPGLLSYLEGTRFVFKSRSDTQSNAGYIILSGVRLSF